MDGEPPKQTEQLEEASPCGAPEDLVKKGQGTGLGGSV